MKFCWSTLIVKNMEESLRFYTDVLGLEIASRFNSMPGLELAFLDAGDVQIELVCNADSQDAVVGDAISLGFEVSSLDEALKMINDKGIPIHSGPFIHPTVKFFFIQDPNGLKIQLKETTDNF
jgi:lactoylglutathione lyase